MCREERYCSNTRSRPHQKLRWRKHKKPFRPSQPRWDYSRARSLITYSEHTHPPTFAVWLQFALSANRQRTLTANPDVHIQWRGTWCFQSRIKWGYIQGGSLRNNLISRHSLITSYLFKLLRLSPSYESHNLFCASKYMQIFWKTRLRFLPFKGVFSCVYVFINLIDSVNKKPPRCVYKLSSNRKALHVILHFHPRITERKLRARDTRD